MLLGLDQRCLNRIREVIVAALPRLEVAYGTYLTSHSLVPLFPADRVPPQGEMRSKLVACIGENPVSTFIFGRVNAELRSQRHAQDQALGRLMDFPEFSDPHAVAARWIADLESLPWEYSITFVMPRAFNEIFVPEIGTFPLSPRTTLASHDATFESKFPIPPPPDTHSFVDFALAAAASRHQAGNSYMQSLESGFMGTYQTTALSRAMQGKVRAFAGLGLALHLFRWSRTYERTFNNPAFVAHRKAGDTWVFECEDAWETDQSRIFAELQLEDLRGELTAPRQKADLMRSLLPRIAVAFTEEQRSRRIRLGAQWLYDSFCESDVPLAFVEGTVVLEVLLGEKAAADEVGLTKLLANRCAYLIASSQSDRERVIKDFTEIYNVRSKIVHEGKSALTLEEYAQLFILRNLCGRVILREIELLEKETGGGGGRHPGGA